MQERMKGEGSNSTLSCQTNQAQRQGGDNRADDDDDQNFFLDHQKGEPFFSLSAVVNINFRFLFFSIARDERMMMISLGRRGRRVLLKGLQDILDFPITH